MFTELHDFLLLLWYYLWGSSSFCELFSFVCYFKLCPCFCFKLLFHFSILSLHFLLLALMFEWEMRDLEMGLRLALLLIEISVIFTAFSVHGSAGNEVWFLVFSVGFYIELCFPVLLLVGYMWISLKFEDLVIKKVGKTLVVWIICLKLLCS